MFYSTTTTAQCCTPTPRVINSECALRGHVDDVDAVVVDDDDDDDDDDDEDDGGGDDGVAGPPMPLLTPITHPQRAS